MQSGLDQPKVRLVAHRKSAAGGSGFEVRIAHLAGHGNRSPGPIRVQYGSNIRAWTAVDNSGRYFYKCRFCRGLLWTPVDAGRPVLSPFTAATRSPVGPATN